MQAVLPHLKRRIERRISPEVIAALMENEFLELVSADDLAIRQETQVFEMVEKRAAAHGQVPAGAYEVRLE